MKAENDSIKKILVIKTSALGDIVRSFPALIAVAKAFPDANIDFVVGEPYVELIEPCPYVSGVIPYKKRKNLEDVSGFLRFAMKLRARKYDMVLNFQNTKRFDWLARLTNAPLRSQIVEFDRPVNGIEGVIRILRTVGLRPSRRHYEFWFTEEDHSYVDEFFEINSISKDDRLVGINPGAGWKSKQWPLERYADLAGRLAKTTGAKIVVFGSEEERDRAEKIRAAAGCDVIINSGDSTIRQAACIIGRCSAFVSNDSGLMHIADIQDIPTVGIFGSTNPLLHGPCREGNLAVFHAVDCSPCSANECNLDFEQYYCLNSIKVDEVFETVRRIMH